jgi:DNA-directed RNA polymerase subunit RPC12/RpoP
VPQCSICGKQMRPRIAARIRRFTGGSLVCRNCATKPRASPDPPRAVCNSCGERIEPKIMRRIMRARSRGRNPPMMCRKCFLKHRQDISHVQHSKTESLDVSEWDCTKCSAPLEPEEVYEIRGGQAVECEYCGSTITLDLFK